MSSLDPSYGFCYGSIFSDRGFWVKVSAMVLINQAMNMSKSNADHGRWWYGLAYLRRWGRVLETGLCTALRLSMRPSFLSGLARYLSCSAAFWYFALFNRISSRSVTSPEVSISVHSDGVLFLNLSVVSCLPYSVASRNIKALMWSNFSVLPSLCLLDPTYHPTFI